MSEESNPYVVGSLWYTSWGYDQTNVEHFQVVRETRGSVVLRRICSEARDGLLYPVPNAWAIDCHLRGNSQEYDEATGGWAPAGAYERDNARGYSEKMCRKPRQSKNGYVRSSLTIDDVRHAWPTTEGEGKYETYAAGGMGH